MCDSIFSYSTDGTFFTRGSPLNLDNPSASEAFAVDPTPDDVAFLKSIPTISSMCFDEPDGCLEIDMDAFRALDPKPDFWLYIDNGSQDTYDGFFTQYVENITEIMGKPPIFIDTLFEHGHGCRDQASSTWNVNSKDADTCYSRSAIDVIKRTIELTEFLGITLDDTEDLKAMCEAATRFSNVAEAAHKRGVRAASMWINVLPESVYVAPFFPYGDTFPRTLEELGMPLIHPGLCMGQPCNSGLYGPEFEIINASSWFVNCQAGQDFASCNDATLYNVDFWLVDGRNTQLLEDLEFFQTAFPDKAILAGQDAHVPMNDGALTYRNVARFLHDIADGLETAKSFYADLGCQDVDVTSNEHTTLANAIKQSTVKPGNVACFNRQYHEDAYCPAGSGESGAGFLRSKQWLYLLAASAWLLLM